jgi:glycerol-3-phosphate acyltransferase PlsY
MNSLQAFFPAAAALLGYLIGSLSFAVIVSRVMGLNDPRTYGSKNPGATNVLRSGSKAAAIVTLLLDAAKGWLPVALVHWFGQPYGLGEGTMAMAGLAAFIGHVYPIFFRFAGGKGVATALGVLLGISPILGLAVAATWLAMAWFFRYSSLASLTAAVAAPILYVLGDVAAIGVSACRKHRAPGPRYGIALGWQESQALRRTDLSPAGPHRRPVARSGGGSGVH